MNPWRQKLVSSLGLGVLLLCLSHQALAHGDTIRVSYKAVQPARLVVPAGTTVHFHNANTSGAPCTVVIGEGTAESPALGRAGGWHYTFEAVGEYAFYVKEYPSRAGLVVVTAPDPE